MTGTQIRAPPASSQRPDAMPDTSQHVSTNKLLGLLRPTQTIVSPPNTNKADTLAHAHPATNKDDLDTTELETTTAWTPPSCAARSSSAPSVEGWQAHLKSDPPIERERVGRRESLNAVSGRHELLNDVTGKELRVFRKSPCPTRRRASAE